MKLIKPYFEIIEQEPGLEGIYKQIELAGRTCYTENTEVLTNKGWKYINTITNEDKVLTYIPETNKLEYDVPNIIVKDVHEKLVKINHPNIKICVTGNHRIYQSVPKKREYSFLTANQLLGIEKINKSKQSRFRIAKFFKDSKRNLEIIELPSISYSKEIKHGYRNSTIETITIPRNLDFMCLLGAYISEGNSFHGEKYGAGSYCQITQDENSLLYRDVITSLNNLNIKYRIDKDPRKPNIKWIKFGNSQCYTFLFDELCGKGSSDKHLPVWFRELPDIYIETILKYMYLGDGSHNKTRNERYLSISNRLLDEVQECFILLGKNGTVSYNNLLNQSCYFEESHRDSWIISRKKHISQTDMYDGKVYCTSTKSGIICIRVDGKTCWCGNCYKSEDKITKDSSIEFVQRMINSNHCYTGDTEILTENGWVKFKDYTGEKVATINKDCSFKGFEIPQRIVKYSYKGNFYYYPSLGIEVTDGHNMFGVFRENKNNFYKNNMYSLFKCNEYYKDNNGREKTLGERMFKTPRHCLNRKFLNPYGELIGFWLGDGCYNPKIKNKLVFHLKKQRKIKYLKQLCEELGYIFKERKSNYYTVASDNIGSLFNSLFYNNGKKISLQYFPSIDIAYSIINGLINSDGSLGINTKTITFTNTNKSIIDWLLMYAPICGYSISNKYILYNNSSKNPLYKVFLLDTDYTLNNDSRNKDSKVIITNKTEEVYCVTVSTGLIMVRGINGITTICGNCAMLEHGTVYLKIPSMYAYNGFNDDWIHENYSNNPYSDVNFYYDTYFITTNYRVLIENKRLDDLKYLCEPTEFHTKRTSVKFVCDKGVSHEIVRHRKFSFAQESTRYCNYSKNKFCNEITYIIPSWLDYSIKDGDVYSYNTHIDLWQKSEDANTSNFLQSIAFAEKNYMILISNGWKPQQARTVLPNSLKTEIIVTGFIPDWIHFFRLRSNIAETGAPHPQMEELATPLMQEFIDRKYITEKIC